MTTEAFRQLQALELNALFDLLMEVEGDIRPVLTLMLSSGRELQGSLVHWKFPGLLLETRECPVYLSIQVLEAVMVHPTSAVLSKLSKGKLPDLQASVPSRLELKRRLQDLGQTHRLNADLDFEAYPQGQTAYLVLGELLADLSRVLSSIGADSQGQEALEEVERLVIRPDDDGPGVVRDGQTLVVQTGTSNGLPTRLAGPDLKQAFERRL